MRELRKMLVLATGFLVLMAGTANAGSRSAKIYVDQSTSMASFKNYTLDHVRKLKNLLEQKGFNVELIGFGKTLKELPSVDYYEPCEGDTDYGLALDDLAKDENTLVFFISDGKLPSFRIRELPTLVERSKKMKDSGIFICADSALKKPTKILEALATIVEPFGEEKKLVDECVGEYEKLLRLNSEQKRKKQKQKSEAKEGVLKVKDIEEEGFKAETKISKGGIVINIYR